LNVNGIAWDLDNIGVITVGGVVMVPVDVIAMFGIEDTTAEPITPGIRLFRLRDMTVTIYEKQVVFWVWRDNPERANSRSGYRRIVLDMPTFVHNDAMYIPLYSMVSIVRGMNSSVDISLTLPRLAPSEAVVERGRDESMLWSRYSGQTVQSLLHAGYSRLDILYLFERIQQNNATVLRQAQREELLLQQAREREEQRAQLERDMRHSQITLPNRRLTVSERAEWIAEYSQLGGVSALELEMVRIVNETRASHGLSRLEICETLMMAARFYAQTRATFAVESDPGPGLVHNVGPYADSPGQGWYPWGASYNIVRAFGGQLRWGGGNANWNIWTAEEVVYRWMNSPGHRRYILAPEHRYIGAGWTLSHGSEVGNVFQYLFMSDRQRP